MTENLLTREQLEERLATLHQASLELVKSTSLEALLERIAVLAMEQVQARYAAVGVLDDEGKLQKFIPIGMTAEEVKGAGHPPVGRGLIGALMNTTETIRIADIDADPRSSGFPRYHPEMKTFLGVPLRQGTRQYGQIYLVNKLNNQEFTDDDQRVMEMLAAYAAVAISNARFYQQITERDLELTQRNQNLALINELASLLASAENVEQVLDSVLRRVVEYLQLDTGEIFLRQDESRIFQMILHHGTAVDRLWGQSAFPVGDGMIGKTVQTGQMQHIDLNMVRRSEDFAAYAFHADALRSDLAQVVSLPLRGQNDVLGVLCVASTTVDPLADLQMQFLSAISIWLGMAVENLRLHVQQRRLAVLEERERIGMDLHDGIIQDIYAVGLTLEHARLLLNENPTGARSRIEQAIDDLNSTIRDIRAYILDLRPRKLHEENLVDGLRRLIAEFRANTLIDTTLQAPPQSVKLPQTQAVALFHICQEALANIAKHASAHHVQIALWTTAERVLLEISDNGLGFELSNTRLTLGHGLSNMQTRARNAGGDLEVSSEPGEGTTILVWVPVTGE